MKLPKVIYMMGMPGAGKGTQAEMLARDIGYKQFSTGNAFRQIALQDTPLGREVKEIMEKGFLTPSHIAAEVVLTSIQNLLNDESSIVFDGTPRTVEEGDIVNAKILERGYGVPLIIYLDVDKDTMIERNSKRRLCLNIEKEFPVTTSADEKRCEEMGGKVGMRPDDERDKFTTRYKQFMDLTYPVIEKHKTEHPEYFFSVDGMPEPHKVHAAVMDIIGQFEI